MESAPFSSVVAPAISVCPYAVTMSAAGNVSAISSSVALGAGDAPHIATRSRPRSIGATRSLRQMTSHWVGTKMHMVTACSSMSRIASAGSNAVLGVTMHVAPRVRNGSSPLMPPMWNSGWPESQTSSSPARISWIQLSVPATRLPCVRTAPLGRPVVPDV